MKLIIYLFKKIIPLFLVAVLFFSLVLNLVDLFMNVATYLQNESSWLDILKVMLLYTPKTLWYAVPVGLLFSTSYSLSDMYAHNELEALFASGVSLLKFTMPLLIFSLIMTVGLFVFENNVVVQTYEKKIDLQNKLISKSTSKNNNNVVVISKNGTIVYKARKYTESSKKLQNVYFIFRTEEKALEAIIYAPSANWDADNERWNLDKPVQYTKIVDKMLITPAENRFTSQLTESYEIFRKNIVDVQSVTAKEAKIYIDHLRKAGLPYQEQLSEYYKKFSFPFIIFLVVFLSIGLTGKTKKNVLLISLASSISAAVLFYVLLMVTMVLAKHGYISAFMGAWFPVIFFTILSSIMLKFART